MRTNRTPSKATFTNKTRPAAAGSFSSSKEGRLAGPVFYVYVFSLVHTMDEGRERDKTSSGGALPMLPGLYHSTFQPSQRGFFRVHTSVWREREPELEFLNF